MINSIRRNQPRLLRFKLERRRQEFNHSISVQYGSFWQGSSSPTFNHSRKGRTAEWKWYHDLSMNIYEDAPNLVVELLSAEEIDGDREIGLTCAGFESLPIVSFVFDGFVLSSFSRAIKLRPIERRQEWAFNLTKRVRWIGYPLKRKQKSGS